MTEKSFRALICGDVEGQFNSFFSKIEQTNKKSGPFDLLLCVGNFMGVNNIEWQGFQSGEKKVAVPTYVLGPNNQDAVKEYLKEENGQLCENVIYLGKRGVYSVAGGLKIAYLSGIETTDKSYNHYKFNKQDVFDVRDACLQSQSGEYRGVDILLTSQWPSGISNPEVKQKIEEENSSQLISWLAAQIKPRYHFVGLNGKFYERSPYRNSGPDGTISIATRFLALARFGNADKQKWLYAANLKPISTMRMMDLCQKTTDETDCPYGPEVFNLFKEKKEQNHQFFYDMNSKYDDSHRKRRHNGQGGPDRKQRPVFDQEKCWFCLASPYAEKHLVISIGEHVYLALAKGGLISDHLLITTITHFQSSSELSKEILDEIEKFKDSLRKYFTQEKRAVVFYERNYKTSHMQIQAIGIPERAQVELKEMFEDEAHAHDIQLEEMPKFSELPQLAPSGVPYFCAELPNGTHLFTRAKKNFPINFGRDVLASGPVLNMENRIDWRECVLPKDEEIENALNFRDKYKAFDFTL